MKRLLIRPGAIGDFIVSLPALESLRSGYTEVWCAEPNVPLARFADRARSIVGAGLDRAGILPADDVLDRLARFDEIHSWYGTARADFREIVAVLPFRFYPALPRDSALSATEFYCRQVGCPVSAPRIPVPPSPRGDFVILHPFASNPLKRWPLDKFRQLATLLTNVQWCAGPEEALSEAVRISDLYELAQWIATARAYVGNDSGITHLAAAVSTPAVALFGPTDPAVWAPLGSEIRVIQRNPIGDISVEEVELAAKSLI